MMAWRVTVTVDEEHLAGVSHVVDELRSKGMQVDSVLENLGMITGTASNPAALRAVEGVQSVDGEQGYQLPDRDSYTH